MTKWTLSYIKTLFLEFLQSKNFIVSNSGSLVPEQDASILFTNAGMIPFKKAFLGEEDPIHDKYVSVQQCVRIGGKTSDIKLVGTTSRHLTSFEMCGFFILKHSLTNIEIKKSALMIVFDFLIQQLELPEHKLFVSIHKQDTESLDICNQIFQHNRICVMDTEDNFWSMGSTGPCGYCVEFLYDRGVEFGDALKPNEDTSGERFLEIWNVVFMQFNRISDTQKIPLKQILVDTGGGLERLGLIKCDMTQVFDLPVYADTINILQKYSNKTKHPNSHMQSNIALATKIISDHLKTTVWLVKCGISPGNTGRNYVLRKILRRLLMKYLFVLEISHKHIDEVINQIFLHVGEKDETIKDKVVDVIQHEINLLLVLINQKGQTMVHNVINKYKNTSYVPVSEIFILKDTHGLPVEYLQEVLSNKGLLFDMNELEQYEEAQHNQNNTPQESVDIMINNIKKEAQQIKIPNGIEVGFCGYTQNHVAAYVYGLFNKHGDQVTTLKLDQYGYVFTNTSSIFPSGGGQMSDHGTIISDTGVFEVNEAILIFNNINGSGILHFGKAISGHINVNDEVITDFSQQHRNSTTRAHSGQHVLSIVLKNIYNMKTVSSKILLDRFYIDVVNDNKFTQKEILDIEHKVYDEILKAHPVCIKTVPFTEVQKDSNISMSADYEYQNNVRVVEIGPSKSLCCGTHVNNSLEIGPLAIVDIQKIAINIYRLEVMLGTNIFTNIKHHIHLAKSSASLLNCSVLNLLDSLNMLLENKKILDKDKKQLSTKIAKLEAELILSKQSIQKDSIWVFACSENSHQLLEIAKWILRKTPTLLLVVLHSLNQNNTHNILIHTTPTGVNKYGLSAVQILHEIGKVYSYTGGGYEMSANATILTDCIDTLKVKTIVENVLDTKQQNVLAQNKRC